jgi:inhibitor of KinA sporulation pathway (predicted exonuclease)
MVYPFSAKHINLKEDHSHFYQVKRMRMKGAIHYHGFAIEGTHQDGWQWKDSVQTYYS